MRKRQGFTLIEMLVAMGLTMFIMVILSEAFGTGLDVFGQLKGIGDMEENLRAATTSIRADLAADHFEGKRRLSDPNIYSQRPRQGFVAIYAGAGAIFEGVDPDGLPSYRSSSFQPVAGGPVYGSHVLHMAVKRRGNGREDFFSATLPAGSPLLTSLNTTFFGQPADARVQDNTNTYSTQWGEKAYWMVQTGTTVEPTNPASTVGTPLFALYVTQLAIVPDNTYVNWGNGLAGCPIPANAVTLAQYSQMSCQAAGTGNLRFNNPEDVTTAANRAFNPSNPPFNAATPTATPGSTLLLTNVISFHVRALRATAPSGMPPQRAFGQDFEDVAAVAPFDTGTSTTAMPDPTGSTTFIVAVAVTLRVWDQKTQQARQITIVQDM